jgi:hypothetical protein
VAPILLALGLLGAAVVVLVLWPLGAAADRERANLQRVSATVVESAPCGTRSPGDLLEVRVGEQPQQVRYDGCGHSVGQQLDVLVPEQLGEDAVALPAHARPSDREDLQQRLYWVLFTLAAVAGAGYVLLLRPRPA